MTCQHGMIIKAINRNLNNVKVNIDSGDRVGVGEFDTRKVQQRWNPSHIAYDNMLGAGLMMTRFEDDMQEHWNHQMIRNQHAQELTKDKTGKQVDMARCFPPYPNELHKTSHGYHHCKAANFYPKTI